MSSKFKIAIIQLHPKIADIEYNFAHASAFIRDAAAQGCTLAVLPEYHLTSWCPSSPVFAEASRAAPELVARYAALAAELGICIVPGTLVEARPDGTLANVAHFIDARGKVTATYQKKNLWHPERPHLTGGEEPHEAFDTPLGGGCRAGLLVCWDLAFPEAFRELVADGARLIIVPAFWLAADNGAEGAAVNPDSERLFLESVVVARAFENTACVVFVNAGGPPPAKSEDGVVVAAGESLGVGVAAGYAGVSHIAMPLVGALGKMGAEEGMQVVEVDLEVLDVAERAYKVREDIMREGWHYPSSAVKKDKSEGY